MKSNSLTVQSFNKVVNNDYVLINGRLMPRTMRKQEAAKEKNSIISKIKEKWISFIDKISILDNERDLSIEKPESTKEIVDKVVNIKLDVNKMVFKDSRVRRYEELKNAVLFLDTTNLKAFSSFNLLDGFNKIDKFLDYSKKYDITDLELEKRIMVLRKKLTCYLIKRVFVELKYLSTRIDYFITTQEKTTFDEATLNTSINDLVCYHDTLLEAYNKYLKNINNKDVFDSEEFNKLFTEVKGKIELVLKNNQMSEKCIFPPKR